MNGSGASSRAAPDHSEYWADDFVPLQNAGKAVLRVLRKDETSAHGDLYRRILSTPAATNVGSGSSSSSGAGSTGTSSSGDSESMPNHHYFSDGKWSHVRSVPLPPHLQAELAKAKMSTMMGLFEQAQMAWMTIDDTIYLWSYNSTAGDNDFLAFQVPSRQPIVSAGLAPPKPGVFRGVVEWCLVVTTKEEAMLCALARTNQQGLDVIRTKFVLPSDWVSFLSVTSTRDGRIFLGGQDGNLYEFDYDLLVQTQYASDATDQAQLQLDKFYDGPSGSCPATLVQNTTRSLTILTHGKRVINSIMNPSRQPPRKCRKLNHSQSSFSSFMPSVLSKLTSALFGDSTTTGGGPIIQMVVDDAREVLYTLSTRGWICVLDIADAPKITLAAVLNTPATARLYLEAVSRGRMYPPSTSSAREGILSFPGGGEAAQGGVGGMDGARRILKLAEQAKSDRRQGASASLLTPVSIQVVPNQESTRITLVAITAGGLRYYLSSLNPSSLGAGPVTPPFGTPRHRHPFRPHSRMTLCHIRAPPSISEFGATSEVPMAPNDQRVDATCYRFGAFFAAFQKNGAAASGNVLVAASADSVARVTQTTKKENTEILTYVAPGGICEVVSYPIAFTGGNHPETSTLPGGRVWDICSGTAIHDELLSLALRSKTPSDTELGFGMAPAYVPPSKRGNSNRRAPKSTAVVPAPTTEATHTVSSLAITVVTNLLLSRPPRYGIDVQLRSTNKDDDPTVYRISNRSGVAGFSFSAADSKSNSGTASTRSARLSPWLLTPDTVSLSPMALQFILWPSTTFLALNAGGLHSFQSPSILQQLSSAILTAGTNVRSDPKVTTFFENYGYAEGCAMCLFLAIKPSSSDDMKEFAKRAALARAYRPSLTQDQSNDHQFSADPWVPAGYTFSSSAIYEGLTLAVARLLRPLWQKPAVVVTEGRVLKRASKYMATPAKVELLLEDDILEQVLSPLKELQRVIVQVFSKAVEQVPLSKSVGASTDQMDVDDDNHYLTRNLEYQRRGQLQTNSTLLRVSEADELAQHIEERNIHSLFRLVSRTSQLLALVSHLRRAHSMPDLPEVDWGQLHGLTISQLVQSREGQERLESTLNSLVTSSSLANTASNVSADTKELAELLSEQCYHFFSPGSRYAFFGFKTAEEALAIPISQRSRRSARIGEAVNLLKSASRNWFSASLVTGRLLRSNDSEDYDLVAERALQGDSPLAKACSLLVDLEDVAALVEICWSTASNFTSSSPSSSAESAATVYRNRNTYQLWEKGLYHKRNGDASLSNSLAMGTSVTPEDAVETCHALIFHHLTNLLNASLGSPRYQLGESMVSVCASSKKKKFLQKFFKHLLNRNYTDVLLRIDSPTLEEWLAVEQKDNLELLLRYYQIQGKDSQAGEVAWQRATGGEMKLSDRIECLVHAVDSFSRASEKINGDRNELQQKLKQSQERLDIARVQGRILQTITSTKYELSKEDAKPLQTALLSANDLLNKYAIPHDMFEYCLVLLDVCKYTDMAHIQQFWKSLLCEEFFPCETRREQTYRSLRAFSEGSLLENPVIKLLDGNAQAEKSLFEDGGWMKGMEATIVRLGGEICRNGESPVFPVDFITTCLEDLRRTYALAVGGSQGSKSLGWSYFVLIAAGIGNLTAVRAYEKLIERENHLKMGVDPKHRLEQLQTIITMLEAFASAARAGARGAGNAASEEMINAYSSGAIFGGFEDYKSKLQGLPLDVSAEEDRLRSLEAAIRQFYA